MKRFVPLAPMILFAVLAMNPGAVWAGNNVWTSIGPEGGPIAALAIDPQNPGTVYAGALGGIFKTTDGGTRWKQIYYSANNSLAFDGAVLAVDPQTPSTLYAGFKACCSGKEVLLKSTDAGASWSPVGSGLTTSQTLPDGRVVINNLYIQNLVIDPTAPSTLYARTTSSRLFRSSDGGGNWSVVPSAPSVLLGLAMDPAGIVYVISARDGVFKNIDGGASWIALNSGLPTEGGVQVLAVDPQNPSTLYGGSASHGVFKSKDGGANWAATNAGLTTLNIQDIAVDPKTTGTVYLWGEAGLQFKSTDAGASWSALTSAPACCLYALAIDPQNSAAIYAGTASGVFKSADGGASWSSINSGLVTTAVSALAFDPQNSGTIYAGTSNGTYRSTNSGASWSALTSAPACCINSLAIDPQNPGTLYSGVQASGGKQNGGIFKSTDGGASWVRFAVPKGGGLHGIALDPQYPSTLYAWNHMALFKSTDGAANWNELGGWRPGDSFRPIWCVDVPTALVIDPQNTNILYVGTCPAGGGIFKSTDGGTSGHALPGVCCGPLAIDRSGTVYAIDWGLGVYKSTDGGTTWNAANSGLLKEHPVRVLVVDPQNPNIVYGGAPGSGAFRSTDGGASWAAVNSGLTNLNVQTLAVDPRNSNTLYAGTNGGGLFSITFGP